MSEGTIAPAAGHKRFVLMFDDLQSVHLFKDVGQIPFQLQRHFGYDVEIVCRCNSEQCPKVDDALKVLKITCYDGSPYRFLLQRASEIDVLMLFHVSTRTIWRGLLYKVLNPRGCLFVKADMSGISIRYAQWGERNFVTQAKRVVLFRQLLKRVDIVSLETKAAFEAIDTVPSHKKLYLPNGFDPDFIEQFGVRRRSFADKDNIILLVGRHGDYAKNSELMLATLGDMGAVGEWQVWFVGSMTAEFEKSKDRFLEQYPQLAEKVRFTGQIDDKRQLFEMYNRSKVLCLTSRWEGFPNVAVEGLAFGLVPVMPDSIACTADIIDDGNCGICFKQDSRTSLSAALSQCIAGDGLESMAHIALQHFNRSFRWQGILKDLDERIRLRLEHTLTK